ncbi:hypothetical protein Q427_10585 [Halomonas sp. BC04]|nr:hypothetical protein Q427_10585 [Halomonas sp. BC04]
MTIDPWQMIFDKAGDLADALLHEQPESEIDSVDREEKVVGAMQKIASGEVSPREDWSVIIRPVRKRDTLDEKIDYHFEIAIRQAVFVRALYEHDMQKIKQYFSEISQFGMAMKVGEDMLSAFACAQQHATAWRLLRAIRDKSNQAKSPKANQVKAERKEERELLLRSLIESSLGRLRPRGGWRNHVVAGQVIAKELAEMAASYSLPITSDEDELSDKVQLMIWKEPRLRAAYNENANKPLDEPVKVRKVLLKFDLNVDDR